MAPSVTEAVATLVTPNENRTEHSITVTCTVRPESDADVCVVMAMADGRMTKSGKELHNATRTHMCVYAHKYVAMYVCIRHFISQNCTHIRRTYIQAVRTYVVIYTYMYTSCVHI